MTENAQKITPCFFSIQGMSCSSCVNKIEQALKKVPGVIKANVNFAEKTATVYSHEKIPTEECIRAIQEAGYEAVLFDPTDRAHEVHLPSLSWLKVVIPGSIGLLFMLMSFFFNHLPHATLRFLGSFEGFITLWILFYAASAIYQKAWRALKHFTTTMDTLIALGISSAWIMSALAIILSIRFPFLLQHLYFESALIILAFINLGQILEAKALGQASSAITRLLALTPKTATVLKEHKERVVSLEAIQVNDVIRIHPGEKIPVDGVVIEGESYVDESMLTGESRFILKKAGDIVTGGTLNQQGSFLFQVKNVGENTVLASMIALVREAQTSKPALAHLADRVSSYFVPIVIGFALLTAMLWLLTGPSPAWLFAFITAMSVLIIACPCAIGLAIPTSVMVALGCASQEGILIRRSEVLQQAEKITMVIFDKTGTLTEGKLSVVNVLTNPGIDKKAVIQLSSSLEQFSEHPIGRAIVKFGKTEAIEPLLIEHFETINGYGVKASINQHYYYLGNAAWMAENNLVNLWSKQKESDFPLDATPLYLADEKEVLGVILVSDPIKQDAKKTIKALQEKNIAVAMLTGDHPRVAAYVAKALSISTFIAEAKPRDKMAFIQEQQQHGNYIAMVGDGINDAPALAQANVGFAMSNGTDIAMQSASVTIIGNSLTSILHTIELSKAATHNMKQNLLGAFLYNAIAIPIAAGVLYPFFGILLNPMIAGLAMALSSITVVINANRLSQVTLRGKVNVK